MLGEGRAHAAITVLNATATGVGCSLAIEGGVAATWRAGGRALRFAGPGDERVVRAVQARVAAAGSKAGADVATASTFPPSRGLKTSSSAAAALLAAARQAHGLPAGPDGLVRDGVAVCRAAGVTLTGALDDQLAVVHGGCHLADNRRGRPLRRLEAERWHVAVWVPDASIDKERLASLDASPAAPAARKAQELAEAGRLPEALTRNGQAFHALYEAAGLPVDRRPVAAALAAGALGAGLSGTGPAVAALFDGPVQLAPAPGGRWHWSRVVP